jgi:hypothetical protein
MQTLESSIEALEKRVAKLEAQNWRFKKAGIASFIIATAIIIMGQAPAKRIVTADEFILKDSLGIVRAKLGFAGVSQDPTLTLIDVNGRERAYLATEAIEFADSNGTTRVLLGSSNAISYKLVEGKTQITDQGPGLFFDGADRKVLMEIRGMSSGSSISFLGQGPAEWGQQAVLESSADGPSLTLSDAQGFRTIAGIASLKTPRTGASTKTSAASVILFDKEGRSVWSAP